jgi:hypothetical protein
MNARQMTFPLPGNGPAVLTLPTALHDLQRETSADAFEPGHIEYASWLQRLAALAH